jgi:hypothetical protein
MLWVGVFYRFEGLHVKVALKRPLLAASEHDLRPQSLRTRLVREHYYYPRSALHLLEQPLIHSPGGHLIVH